MHELLLTLKPVEAYNYPNREERLRWILAYRDRGRLVALIEEARSLGASEIVAVVSPELHEVIGYVRAHQPWRFSPVVPNMFSFIRDLTEFGMVGAARKRALRMGPVAMMRFGGWAMRRVSGILSRDFTVGAMVLLRMELATLRHLAPDGMYLHPQLAEIALATANREFFERCWEDVETGFGMRLGLITNNPVRACTLFDAWGLQLPRLMIPFNAKGYKMFPDRQRCEGILREHRDTVTVMEITADHTLDPESALDYLTKHDVRQAAIDIREVSSFFRTFGPRRLTGADAANGGRSG